MRLKEKILHKGSGDIRGFSGGSEVFGTGIALVNRDRSQGEAW